MNVLQTALEAIELLTTDNTSEAAQAAAADARIKLMNAVEPFAYVTKNGIVLTPCDTSPDEVPLYLHPAPQQSVEPVAYFLKDPSGHFHEVSTKACYPGSLPLCLQPQQVAVPEPLSDAQIEEIASRLDQQGDTLRQFARAIERAHGITQGEKP